MNLLIVDDERHIVNWIRALFLGHPAVDEAFTAFSAQEALAHLDARRIDVVITDIRMPRMGGLELMREIVNRHPRCQIIFLTGHSEFEYVYEAIRYPNVQYLLKTEDDERIVSALEEAVARSQAWMAAGPDVNPEATLDPVVRELTEYIQANLAGDLSLAALSAQVHYNPSYLSRLFKRVSGTNLNQYVFEQRMQRARQLLKTPRTSVSSAAHEVGFENAQYFATAFKRRFGITPQACRDARHVKE